MGTDSEIRRGEEPESGPDWEEQRDAGRVVRLVGPAIPVLTSTGAHSPLLGLCVSLWTNGVVGDHPDIPSKCL